MTFGARFNSENKCYYTCTPQPREKCEMTFTMLHFMFFILLISLNYGMHMTRPTHNTKQLINPVQWSLLGKNKLRVTSLTQTTVLPLKINPDDESSQSGVVNTTASQFDLNGTEILSDFISYEGLDNETSLKDLGYTERADQDCIGNIEATSGNISSRHLTTDHKSNTQCDWIISVPVNFKVRLKFITFDLPPKTNERCLKAYLEFGGFDKEGLRLVHGGHHCSTTNPEQYVTPDNRCWIYFFRALPSWENENYSFFITFDVVQVNGSPDLSSSSRIGLLALLVILVPIVCSIVTYCCLKKRRITKMEVDYYNRFKSKYYPSVKSTRRNGEQIQIKVSKPSDEEYTEDISIINSSLQYDMLPNQQKNYHVYRVMRPTVSARRSDDSSVFLHEASGSLNLSSNTLDQDDFLPSGRSVSSSSGQFLTIPQINNHTSYLSLRPVLDSNSSGRRSSNFNSFNNMHRNKKTSSSCQSSLGSQRLTPTLFDQDSPVIYVQNPDKLEKNMNKCISQRDQAEQFGFGAPGITMKRHQTQNLFDPYSNSWKESPTLNNARKFKDRSKSLSLPTHCFMAPQFESRTKLLSERQQSFREWGEARHAFHDYSTRDDHILSSGLPNSFINERGQRERGHRKPSISRPPRLAVLPEVDPSDSASFAENHVMQEIYVKIPPNEIYMQQNPTFEEENINKSTEENENNLLKVTHNAEDGSITHQQINNASSSCNISCGNRLSEPQATELSENSRPKNATGQFQVHKLQSVQSERSLCEYKDQSAIRSNSFQEKFTYENLDQGVFPKECTFEYRDKTKAKSVPSDIGAIQVKEHNKSLNMLRYYDVPCPASDESQPQTGYKEKDIQFFLTEEMHVHREQIYSSETFQNTRNATYIVPKVKNTSQGNRRNSYRTEESKNVTDRSSLTNRTTNNIPESRESRRNLFVPRPDGNNAHNTELYSYEKDPMLKNYYMPHNNTHELETTRCYPKMLDSRRSNSFQQDLNQRNISYMSKSVSQSFLPDTTRHNSYMFEITRNASYMQEMGNVNASYIPDSSQVYGLQLDASQEGTEYIDKHFDGNKSMNVDINNNTDDNPSVTILDDFYPNQSGVIVLEEGESMV